MQFYYRGDDLAPVWPFLGLELLYDGIFIITLHVLSKGSGSINPCSYSLIKAYMVMGWNKILQDKAVIASIMSKFQFFMDLI